MGEQTEVSIGAKDGLIIMEPDDMIALLEGYGEALEILGSTDNLRRVRSIIAAIKAYKEENHEE